MQKIQIKDISTKSGTNARGEWKLFNLTGADGAKFSTFDHKAAELKIGDIIEAEIEIKGKNNDIKSFTILEHGTVTSIVPANNPPADTSNTMTKEEWAEKDRIERASIEAQTAFKGIMEFASHSVCDELKDPRIVKAFDRALDWAMEKLGGKPSTKPIQAPVAQEKAPDKQQGGQQQADKPKRDITLIKGKNEMTKACHEDFGMNQADWIKEGGYKSFDEIAEPLSDIYQRIAAVRKK